MMPGYNHYPWCTCGWCYKTGSGAYSARHRRAAIADSFGAYHSKRLLVDKDAYGSWSACFVSHNAKCPVCGARVYFYQNTSGSRVFFDALGWPWPKHPCTDRGSIKAAQRAMPMPHPIKARPLGEVREILRSALAIDFDPNAEFRKKYGVSPLDLFAIERASQIGFRHRLIGRALSPPCSGRIAIEFDSASFVPDVDAFFSLGEGTVSLFDFQRSQAREFKASVFCNRLEPLVENS